MKTQSRKNPLNHRLLRELKSDFARYLVIFLLMVLSIAESSGFLVADNSLIRAYNDGFVKYNIEDGHFETADRMNNAQIDEIEEEGVRLYDLWFTEADLENGTLLRIYPERTEVDLVDLMEGELPAKTGEIAIDRMYAKNNDIAIGDTIRKDASSKSWKVTGYVAFSDYSCLFQNNNDSMFDAKNFGVGMVSAEEFAKVSSGLVQYNYAWKYQDPPADEEEESDRAEDLMKKISGVASLRSFVPQYANQAIQFTGDDFGSDGAMMTVLLYIIIAILAFVFAVTISSTITKEAAVIGTLRASGYTKGELIRHYMKLPLIVTLISAAVGNILGYTVMKDLNAALEYASYSLPTYHTLWNTDAFVKTTVVPVILMIVITYVILRRKLSISPLNFLRRDLRHRKSGGAVKLSHRIPILSRFRTRIVFQNMPNYIVLFFGVIFADILLMFGLAMPAVLKHYQDSLSDQLFCKYQYILTVPASLENDTNPIATFVNEMLFSQGVRTDNPDAEEFSIETLKTTGEGGRKVEDVSIYGIRKNSRYLDLDMEDGDVVVSHAYAAKYDLEKGSTVTLKEAYGDKTYDFKVTGIYDYDGSLCIFMPIREMNRMFDYDADFFAGYFSDTEITDLNPDYVGTVIDIDSLTKISRQLQISMGSLMDIVSVFAVLMFMILVYLLSRTIIEKNAQSISMTKIIGYRNGEISRLYILPTTIAVALMLVVAIPIVRVLLGSIYNWYILTSMAGYMPLYVNTGIYAEMFLLGFAVYLIVVVLEMRRIRRIPMDEALKNIE